jgi:hypothetical protein
MARFAEELSRLNAICQWAKCPNRVRINDKTAAIKNLGPVLQLGAMQLHVSCAEARNRTGEPYRT